MICQTAILLVAYGTGGLLTQGKPNQLPPSQLKLLPARLQQLAGQLIALPRNERRARWTLLLGPPSASRGSGVTILEWDFPEGALTMVVEDEIGSPLFRLRSGRLIYLTPAATPISRSIQSSHEMDAPHPRHKGMAIWIGNINLVPAGAYVFTDSGTNREYRGDQKHNFFMKYPVGRYVLTYATGIESTSLLELLTKKGVVAKLTFQASGGKSTTGFEVVCDPDLRRMRLRGSSSTPFTVEWGF